ncbi:unnamed protein product, partial [Mesorhabditis spiculigera]
MESIVYKNAKIEIYDKLDIGEICESEAKKRDLKGLENAFAVVNLDEILDRIEIWKKLLPNPFYAIKSNGDAILVDILTRSGIGIDCASSTEMETALQYVPNDMIINSHPCSSPGTIQHSARLDIPLIVFDHIEQLKTIHRLHPNSKPIFRFALPTEKGGKFGCAEPEKLLEEAWKLGLTISGISFYVGPSPEGCLKFDFYLRKAKDLIRLGKDIGHSIEILNIGGSFPGAGQVGKSFETVVHEIQPLLTECHKEWADLRIIAEPGKFFSSSPFTLCSKIMLAKPLKNGEEIEMHYYLNQGIYNSFMGTAIRNKVLPEFGKAFGSKENASKYPSTIWGPSCDGADCLEKNSLLPRLATGDWLMFKNRGAYSFSMGGMLWSLSILLAITVVRAWPDGAPCVHAAFESMNPLEAVEHQGGLQLSEPPYEVAVDQQCYWANQPIGLTIQGKNATIKFKGFAIQPFEWKNGRVTGRIGQFIRLDDNGSWQQQCFRKKDSATHSHDEKKKHIKLWWKSDDDSRTVQFIATVVEHIHKFWVKSVVSPPIPPCRIARKTENWVPPFPTPPPSVKAFKLETHRVFGKGGFGVGPLRAPQPAFTRQRQFPRRRG